ncbi:unnamed protein product [Zymoseptoria tritici ST99CH_1A5]|uniref:Heterokaryon incompatibility domain-containing protein n=1 Tax=Zymoseptoria tritici ST99CH_1A5 TaxID=1276529 RepID=A0A1Y6LZ62_ZYMTR|nr:unnamed protein product [Zymoseptoria tritici ST99CH_1A5]
MQARTLLGLINWLLALLFNDHANPTIVCAAGMQANAYGPIVGQKANPATELLADRDCGRYCTTVRLTTIAESSTEVLSPARLNTPVQSPEMFDKDVLISARTLTIGGREYVRDRNEHKIKYSGPYVHEPLSGPRTFRLLRIHPGAYTEVISVEMYEANPGESPSFDALSYTWNLDPTWSVSKGKTVADKKREQRHILCNGRTLHITMNLYHALTEFRRTKSESPIWADQVCINQQDNVEEGTLNKSREWALTFLESLPDERIARTLSTYCITIGLAESLKIDRQLEIMAAAFDSGPPLEVTVRSSILETQGPEAEVRPEYYAAGLVGSDAQTAQGTDVN